MRGTTYESFEELVVYCRHVAGSIGRLCLAIFGSRSRPVRRRNPLADDLGVAMQLTNILRAVREDSQLGRVYLPAEDLRRFGIERSCEALLRAAVAELIRFEAARNREWFDRGLELASCSTRRSHGSCLLAMTGIYRGILERIERQPAEVLERRISVPVWEKAWLAARSLAGGKGWRASPSDRARRTPLRRPEREQPRVVVVGGGLAGIAAALDCASTGRG